MGDENVATNQTLYVRGLNEKVKIDELRKGLYQCFKKFGQIRDVMARRSYFMRGQAWVVFDDVASAVEAKKQMQGFPLFDKPLDIMFAKTKTDAIAKEDGTYVKRPKRKRDAQPHLQHVKKVATEAGPVSTGAVPDESVPNKTLICSDLPAECNEAMLTSLFEQYAGFAGVKAIPKKRVAFVDFGSELEASAALQGLRGFKLSATEKLKVTYAKKD